MCATTDLEVSCRELTMRGREEARSAGLSDVPNATAIQYGLVAFAKANPLTDLKPEQVRNLIRGALYALSSAKMLEEALIEQAAERLVMTLERYSGLSFEEFERLYVAEVASWIRNAANRKHCTGGVMAKDVLRQAVLQLGWQAYDYLADCLVMFNTWFITALPEKLSEDEQERFLQVFGRQPHYGNLPLLLMMERHALFSPVVSQLVEAPENKQLVGTFHRLLAIYADMCRERRLADCRSKKQSPVKPRPPRGAVASPDRDISYAASESDVIGSLPRTLLRVLLGQGSLELRTLPAADSIASSPTFYYDRKTATI